MALDPVTVSLNVWYALTGIDPDELYSNVRVSLLEIGESMKIVVTCSSSSVGCISASKFPTKDATFRLPDAL